MEEIKKEPIVEAPKPTAVNMVQSANEAYERLKGENERLEKNIKELAELKAIERLGGLSQAGIQPPKPVEESPQEYTKRIMSGKL